MRSLSFTQRNISIVSDATYSLDSLVTPGYHKCVYLYIYIFIYHIFIYDIYIYLNIIYIYIYYM